MLLSSPKTRAPLISPAGSRSEIDAFTGRSLSPGLRGGKKRSSGLDETVLVRDQFSATHQLGALRHEAGSGGGRRARGVNDDFVAFSLGGGVCSDPGDDFLF